MDDGKGEPARAFIAIDLPDDIKESISLSMGTLQKDAFRPVGKDSMHITLFFLGDMDGKGQEAVTAAMENLSYGKFYVSVKGISTFSIKRPHAIFANIEEGSGDLAKIYKSLFEELKAAGMRTEQRPYTPHITIARVRRPNGKVNVREFLDENANRGFGRFLCESIKLKRSVLTGTGPIHTDMYVKYLATNQKQ